jgi:hypothetical protein
MTAPVKRVRARLSALPEPELITLLDDPDSPYANSPVGWWTEYGGALDVRSGVAYFPPGSSPPCSLPDCKRHGGGNSAHA